MTNDYDGAVDLAQETFVRVYRAAGRYQTTHAFSTYIYRIATNLAISELRKRKRPAAGFIDRVVDRGRGRGGKGL
jgi:RNA polymerase sigma-70 factor (ECF subfamily)